MRTAILSMMGSTLLFAAFLTALAPGESQPPFMGISRGTLGAGHSFIQAALEPSEQSGLSAAKNAGALPFGSKDVTTTWFSVSSGKGPELTTHKHTVEEVKRSAVFLASRQPDQSRQNP